MYQHKRRLAHHRDCVVTVFAVLISVINNDPERVLCHVLSKTEIESSFLIFACSLSLCYSKLMLNYSRYVFHSIMRRGLEGTRRE